MKQIYWIIITSAFIIPTITAIGYVVDWQGEGLQKGFAMGIMVSIAYGITYLIEDFMRMGCDS